MRRLVRAVAALAMAGVPLAMAGVSDAATGTPNPSPSATATATVGARTGGPGAGLDLPGDGEIAISFTFDGAYKGQEEAAKILFKHDMAGTFYVNSGYLGYPAYMTRDDLRDIARQRSEIGGGSLYSNNLTDISRADAREQVCDDRATLAQLGFPVTSFSYPYGDDSAQAKSVAQECGYNNARVVSGLFYSATDCSDCPLAESIPPVDDFRIRTPSYTNDVASIEKRINAAREGGGGWLPLIFGHVCVCPELGNDAITPAAFEQLVSWVAAQGDAVKVFTVDQVMGGPLRDVKGTAVQRLLPGGITANHNSVPLSSRPAWSLLGFDIDQTQIMVLGILMALSVVITYRIATKKVRHVRAHD